MPGRPSTRGVQRRLTWAAHSFTHSCWFLQAYLVAAHGLCGIVYVLVHVMDLVDELDSEVAAQEAATGANQPAGGAGGM
jgi:hypothetical protein